MRQPPYALLRLLENRLFATCLYLCAGPLSTVGGPGVTTNTKPRPKPGLCPAPAGRIGLREELAADHLEFGRGNRRLSASFSNVAGQFHDVRHMRDELGVCVRRDLAGHHVYLAIGCNERYRRPLLGTVLRTGLGHALVRVGGVRLVLRVAR